jgi:hypothetical protein
MQVKPRNFWIYPDLFPTYKLNSLGEMMPDSKVIEKIVNSGYYCRLSSSRTRLDAEAGNFLLSTRRIYASL